METAEIEQVYAAEVAILPSRLVTSHYREMFVRAAKGGKFQCVQAE